MTVVPGVWWEKGSGQDEVVVVVVSLGLTCSLS